MDRLEKGKVFQILGPRQSGKTTLLHQIQAQTNIPTEYYNCDETLFRTQFSQQNSDSLRSILGNNKLILLDEAQKVDNIGLTLKIIHDTLPDIKVVVTGSSAFELSDKLNEALTGRKYEYHLYPFAFEELAEHESTLKEMSQLPQRLIFGSYPEVVNNPGSEREVLTELCNSYLYKDVFSLFDIRKPDLVENLLQALAFQISNEVSYNQLAQLLGCDKETVERYILILERAYIIFRLRSYSSNQRNEIKRSRKIYFYDNGIRNSLIADYNPIELRQDIGKLWENYIVSEFVKRKANNRLFHKEYFWRSITSGEIDYLEMKDAHINAFEIKWNEKKKPKAKSFLNLYPSSTVNVVNPSNFFRYFVPNW